ncbi:hypothetical protein Ancab_009216 [Ancistrocladus abbreviatus]
MASILSIIIFLGYTISLSTTFAEHSRKELRSKTASMEALARMGHSYQSSRINTLQVVQLSWRPRVFIYKGFISDEECDHLVSLEQQKKEASGLGNNNKGLGTRSDLDIEDNIVSRIEEKISTWTLLPRENSSPLQVLRYGHEEAKRRYDYFDNKPLLEAGQPLMATVILYLSNVTHGGEIFFPESELRNSGLKSKLWSYSTKSSNLLKPIKGNAVLFFHVHPNASPDKSSSHERHPVTEGELLCATKHFYLRAISGRGVQFETDNSECTDEDESCPKWAALGECQRNPVFMVGSPDYYGTCRKSCNVC